MKSLRNLKREKVWAHLGITRFEYEGHRPWNRAKTFIILEWFESCFAQRTTRFTPSMAARRARISGVGFWWRM